MANISAKVVLGKMENKSEAMIILYKSRALASRFTKPKVVGSIAGPVESIIVLATLYTNSCIGFDTKKL